MYSSETIEVFLRLVRMGIGNGFSRRTVIPDNVDWGELKALAVAQGLTAIVLDGLNMVQDERSTIHGSMPQLMRLEWIGGVLQNYEARYKQYEKAISSLAGWYNQHGFKMMVLKGYACSLDWPKPEHRPCGDIDIWQFGQYQEADATIAKEKGLKIDSSHHHHTVFDWHGFLVENHYDFINIHHHKSNLKLDKVLKELASDDNHLVEVIGENVYIPSPNFHAFFLLRHTMNHFSSSEITFRQLLDWAFFVEKHGKDVDWEWFMLEAERFEMTRLFHVFNAICVEELGFSPSIFPMVQYEPMLKEKVLKEIIEPGFSGIEPKGIIRRVIFKYRRWKANGWKHELCYKESMWSAFWSGVWSHILKPSSI